ncbi:MAG TPA: hypothetical protein PLP44_05265 [Methylophilus sp.]|jgi:uncharacterized membrane protein|nr:hypothetical protein [Methylophilus sp.]
MKYIHTQRPWSVIFRLHVMWLFTALLFGTTAVYALEETANVAGEVPYQSAFEDYRATSKDTLTDWKTITQSSESGGHSGHQMQGMQHDMTSVESKSAESGMDHSSMNHGMMTHNDVKMDSATNSKMDHEMAKMGHSHMKHEMSGEKSTASPSEKSEPEMSEMDHSKMTSMEHQHGASVSSMGKMDHSQMATMAQPSKTLEPNDPEAAPHSHDSGSGMQGHGMTKPMPSMDTKTTETSASTTLPVSTGFSIIPNMHPAIVHFPIALTLISLLFGLSARILRKHSAVPLLAAAGHFTLWLSALSAVVAVIIGWLAFNSGMNHDDAGHAAMLLHRKWAIPTALGLVVLAGIDAWKSRLNQLMSLPTLALLFVLSGAIATTAWLGGEVVYRHGIGVLSLPASEVAGHNHQHSSAKATEHADGVATSYEHTDHQHDATQGESHEH